ncbi:secreted protein C-like isoform X2 [Paramacrobiotus metropolitanus]|uniref:secreted protein C-like isoform X2 n=1 Tax=Paramacrobiotus metropolitanus TaxID=2943436 RepID=UPI0024464B18|nr:secreted protein C-like isoform X2 [Paramacrobiotus metropolitanus]
MTPGNRSSEILTVAIVLLFILAQSVLRVTHAANAEPENKTAVSSVEFSKTYDSAFIPSPGASKKADLLKNVFGIPAVLAASTPKPTAALSLQKSANLADSENMHLLNSQYSAVASMEDDGSTRSTSSNGTDTSGIRFLELPSSISNVALTGTGSSKRNSYVSPDLNITYANYKPIIYATTATTKRYTTKKIQRATPAPVRLLSPSSYDIITAKSQRESRADDYTDSDSSVPVQTSYKTAQSGTTSGAAGEDGNYGDGYNLGYIAAAGENAYSGWGGNDYGGGGGSYGGNSYGGGSYSGGSYGGGSSGGEAYHGGSSQSGYGGHGWGWGGSGWGNNDQTLLYALAIKYANLRDRYQDDIEYRDALIASMQKKGLFG